MSQIAFDAQFRFLAAKAGYVGVEREQFIINREGLVVPQAPLVLAGVNTDREFGYELSACQIETRTGPSRLEDLRSALEATYARLYALLSSFRLGASHIEVGPRDMPLDVYPDPKGRYQQITKDMPIEVLLAACRVIGTHVHVGMRNREEAILVYNYVIKHLMELCELGNGSFGERLAIYRQMAPDYMPEPYADWNDYYQVALQKGFAEDPRKCWTLIRISVHGTIEFRMFGATDSIDRVCRWAERCHALCQEALVLA